MLRQKWKMSYEATLPLALLLACVPAGRANPLNVTLNSVGPDSVVGVRIIPVGSSSLQLVDAYAGVFNMTLTDPSTHVSMTFNTFCIDTSHEVSVGQTYQVNQLDVSSSAPPTASPLSTCSRMT